MDEKFSKIELTKIVLSELETYAKIVEEFPNINDDHHYAPLRSNKCAVYRAIHWYLLDKTLVYQDVDDGKTVWKIKKFNTATLASEISEKYNEYLNVSIEKIRTDDGKLSESFELYAKRNNIIISVFEPD